MEVKWRERRTNQNRRVEGGREGRRGREGKREHRLSRMLRSRICQKKMSEERLRGARCSKRLFRAGFPNTQLKGICLL